MFVPITMLMINTPKVYKPTLSMRFPHWLSDKPLNEGRIGLAFELTIGRDKRNFRFSQIIYRVGAKVLKASYTIAA
jgi:hypothetical protein